MSVGKIVLGVFLGILAFGLLAASILWLIADSQRRQADIDGVNATYNAIAERQQLQRNAN